MYKDVTFKIFKIKLLILFTPLCFTALAIYGNVFTLCMLFAPMAGTTTTTAKFKCINTLHKCFLLLHLG